MVVPVLVAFGVASLAATAAQGGMSFAANKGQEANAKLAAMDAEIRANQKEVVHRENLEFDLAQIRAARAANGLGKSPTGRAILDERRRTMARERRIDVGNERARADSLREDARRYSSAARMALFQTGFKLATQSFSLFTGPAFAGGLNPNPAGG